MREEIGSGRIHRDTGVYQFVATNRGHGLRTVESDDAVAQRAEILARGGEPRAVRWENDYNVNRCTVLAYAG